MSNPVPALPYSKTNYIIPNRRVNGFIGRDDVLERINVGFPLSAAPRIVVICGLGMTSLRYLILFTRCFMDSLLQFPGSRWYMRPAVLSQEVRWLQIGGQGKTQVALEHCHRVKTTGGVRTILWVDAMSQDSVEKAFVTISESIKLPSVTFEDEKSRVRFVLEQLSDWQKYVNKIIFSISNCRISVLPLLALLEQHS